MDEYAYLEIKSKFKEWEREREGVCLKFVGKIESLYGSGGLKKVLVEDHIRD